MLGGALPISINKAERIFQAPRAELVGQSILERFPYLLNGSLYEVRDARRAATEGQPVRFDMSTSLLAESWYEVQV